MWQDIPASLMWAHGGNASWTYVATNGDTYALMYREILWARAAMLQGPQRRTEIRRDKGTWESGVVPQTLNWMVPLKGLYLCTPSCALYSGQCATFGLVLGDGVQGPNYILYVEWGEWLLVVAIIVYLHSCTLFHLNSMARSAPSAGKARPYI